MRLDRSFAVAAPAIQVWAALLDAAQTGPLLPGLTLTDSGEDRFAGNFEVRVGPIGLCYRGSGRYVVRDPTTRRLMIEVAGQDIHGTSTVAATVLTSLRERPGRTTRVELCVELVVTGPLMQTNRRPIQAAGSDVVRQFAENLTARATAGGQSTPEPGESPAPARSHRLLRGLLPYLCGFVLGGTLALAMVAVFV